MDSMRGYLDNISNVLVKTVDSYPYQNMSKLDSASSEPEDETSIQETITIKDRIDGKIFFQHLSNHLKKKLPVCTILLFLIFI